MKKLAFFFNNTCHQAPIDGVPKGTSYESTVVSITTLKLLDVTIMTMFHIK